MLPTKSAQWKISGAMIILCCRIVNVIKNKNIKNSLGATWNASHLAVRLCAFVIGNEFPCRQPHIPSDTLLRGPSTLPQG